MRLEKSLNCDRIFCMGAAINIFTNTAPKKKNTPVLNRSQTKAQVGSSVLYDIMNLSSINPGHIYAKSNWVVPDPIHVAKETDDDDKERLLWVGSSSQIVNFSLYVACFLIFWLVIPIFVAIWAWIEVASRRYELTTERLKIYTGVLTKRVEDLQLYRVKDTCCVEPFFYRLIGLGNVELHTSDQVNPIVIIHAIPNARELRERLRKIVEINRDHKGVTEVDYFTRDAQRVVGR